MSHVAILCVRNEGAFLLEWLADHRAVGFDHFVVFSNDCQDNYGLVQLNHYPLGAMESYVLKADRGRAVHSADMLGVDYWVERNFNTDQDLSIQSLAPARNAELEALMSDSALAQLHTDAITWRKARFEQLMQKEPFRALFGRLMMTPSSVPVPRNAAQFMVHFANMARNTAK